VGVVAVDLWHPGPACSISEHAAAHQLNADLIFEIADLTTEGRLRRVQLFLGRDRQASGLGNSDEVAKGAAAFHIFKAWCPAYKVFFLGASGSYSCSASKPERNPWRLLGLRLG
jgi:hypothetical protein